VPKRFQNVALAYLQSFWEKHFPKGELSLILVTLTTAPAVKHMQRCRLTANGKFSIKRNPKPLKKSAICTTIENR
jgi:hypothetical protein